MSVDKPARQYTKLIQDLKVLQQRNRELEAESLTTAARIQDAVDTALESARTDHAAEITKTLHQATTFHEKWNRASALLVAVTSERDETERRLDATKRGLLVETARVAALQTESELLSTITAERDEAQRSLRAETARAGALAAQVVDIQPQLALIAQQRSDLTHILDTVRDRMRRREQQDEQAILNRRSITRMLPDKN